MTNLQTTLESNFSTSEYMYIFNLNDDNNIQLYMFRGIDKIMFYKYFTIFN